MPETYGVSSLHELNIFYESLPVFGPISVAFERRFTLTEYESPTSPTSVPFASLVEDESLELLGRCS